MLRTHWLARPGGTFLKHPTNLAALRQVVKDLAERVEDQANIVASHQFALDQAESERRHLQARLAKAVRSVHDEQTRIKREQAGE